MYQYSVTQWVFFFYFYCFFGWCFESAYVSIKTRKLTNRGFMHGPFLPLYGSGAMRMLVVSAPFQDSIALTYLAGCVGATILEYCTGVTMEALFKVRYWDYSSQRFNFQGHICLKSTLAWGGLTILMTAVVHRYVEQTVFMIQAQVLSAVTFVLTAVIFADFALSFKAALDLRDVLVRLEEAKTELGHLQRRMDVFVALTTEEMGQRIKEYKDGVRQKKENIAGAIAQKREDIGAALAEFFEDAENTAQEMEPSRIKERLQERIATSRRELLRRREETLHVMEKRLSKLFRANPSIASSKYHDAIEELKQRVGHKE
ncbi:MAG: putative ABC transporter permease [Lachnospiraceae bacterium]|nr:putative ABC transporter permease [Lachnospiraceae bacterium]